MADPIQHVRYAKINRALSLMEQLSGQLTPQLTKGTVVEQQVDLVLNELDLTKHNAEGSDLTRTAPQNIRGQYASSLLFVRKFLGLIKELAATTDFNQGSMSTKRDLVTDMQNTLSQAYNYLLKLHVLEQQLAKAA